MVNSTRTFVVSHSTGVSRSTFAIMSRWLTEGLTLPDEILGMICQELGRERDFGALYRCAQSSSSFADPALRTMYQ